MASRLQWLKSADGLLRIIAIIFAGGALSISGGVMDQTRYNCIPIRKALDKNQTKIRGLDGKIGRSTAKNLELPKNTGFIKERTEIEYETLVPLEGALISFLYLIFLALIGICFLISIVNFVLKLLKIFSITPGSFFWCVDVIFHLAAGLILYYFTVYFFIKIVRSLEGNGHLLGECEDYHRVKGNVSELKRWRETPARKKLFKNKEPFVCLSKIGHYLRMLAATLGVYVSIVFLIICILNVLNKLKDDKPENDNSGIGNLEQEKKVWIEEKPAEAAPDKKMETLPEEKTEKSPEENVGRKSDDKIRKSSGSDDKIRKTSGSDDKIRKSSGSDDKIRKTSGSDKKIEKPPEEKVGRSSDAKSEKTPEEIRRSVVQERRKSAAEERRKSVAEERRKSVAIAEERPRTSAEKPPDEPEKKDDPTGGQAQQCRIT